MSSTGSVEIRVAFTRTGDTVVFLNGDEYVNTGTKAGALFGSDSGSGEFSIDLLYGGLDGVFVVDGVESIFILERFDLLVLLTGFDGVVDLLRLSGLGGLTSACRARSSFCRCNARSRRRVFNFVATGFVGGGESGMANGS